MPQKFRAERFVGNVFTGSLGALDSLQDSNKSSGVFGQYLRNNGGITLWGGLTGANLGAGAPVYDQNNSNTLTFRTLSGVGSISTYLNGNVLMISGSSSGNGGGVGDGGTTGFISLDGFFEVVSGVVGQVGYVRSLAPVPNETLLFYTDNNLQSISIGLDSDVTIGSSLTVPIITTANLTNTGTLTVGNLTDDSYILSSGGTFWIGNAMTGITGKLNFFMIGDPSNSNIKFYLDQSGVHLTSCLFDSAGSSGSQGYIFTSTTSGYFWKPDVDVGGGGAVLSGGVSGYVTKWFSSSGVTTSNIYDNGSNIAIGANTFDATNPEELKIEAGVTSSVNALAAYGNINSYFQLNIRNSGGGTNSSSDVICTSNNGNETGYYVDLGINSNGWTNFGEVGGANDGYLYNLGNNFWIGNATNSPTGRIYFFAGGLSSTGNMRVYIDSSGLHLNSCLFDTSNKSGTVTSTSVLASVPGVGYQWSTAITGLPAGPNFSVQFNNGGGGISGAQNLLVDNSGYLNVKPYGITDTILKPATGATLITVNNTRNMISQIGQRGDIYSFQPFLGDKIIRTIDVIPGSTQLNSRNIRLATSGTVTSINPTATTFGASIFNTTITSTASVTGGAGIWGSGLNTYYRSAINGVAGNSCFLRVIMSPPSLPAGGLQRFFVGLLNSGTLVLSRNEPSQFKGMVGFGIDSGDTTYQFIMNNGRGATTQKINTSISMYTMAASAASNPTGLLTATFYMPPTGSGIAADLVLNNGLTQISYSYRADSDGNVPSSGLFLSPHAFWWHPTGIATNSVAGFVNLYMETDN